MSDVETRASNAEALKDNPLLQEIIDQLKSQAVQAWVATAADGGERARELAWITYKNAQRIEAMIQAAIDDGLIAAARVTAPLR